MLKVLCVNPAFPINLNRGSNLYLWHSIEALKKRNIDTHLLHTPGWKLSSKNKIDTAQFPIQITKKAYFSIPRHYAQYFSNLSYQYSIVPVIKKIIEEQSIDIIHAHGEMAGLVAVIASKKFGIPSVVTLHGIDTCHRMWKKSAKKMFCEMLNLANRIVFVGKPLQTHFSSMLTKTDHCRIIQNGSYLPKNSALPFNKDKLHIVSVSNLHEGKGVDLTLLALARLKSKGVNDWFYTIVGDGYERKKLEKIVSDNHLQNQVKFVGVYQHDAVYALLEKADIFCLPSYREAFGIAYVEAMMHGLLTIGVKGQGPSTFLTHQETGLLVEPKDVNSVCEALYYAMTHRDEMREIAERGQMHAISNYSWEKHAEKLSDVYKEVCSI